MTTFVDSELQHVITNLYNNLEDVIYNAALLDIRSQRDEKNYNDVHFQQVIKYTNKAVEELNDLWNTELKPFKGEQFLKKAADFLNSDIY